MFVAIGIFIRTVVAAGWPSGFGVVGQDVYPGFCCKPSKMLLVRTPLGRVSVLHVVQSCLDSI